MSTGFRFRFPSEPHQVYECVENLASHGDSERNWAPCRHCRKVPNVDPPLHYIQFPDGKVFSCVRDAQQHLDALAPCVVCDPVAENRPHPPADVIVSDLPMIQPDHPDTVNVPITADTLQAKITMGDKLQVGGPVVHPPHYNQVPGVECIDVVKHFPFCRGNAIKYLWRAGAKGDVATDLRKAIEYIQFELADLEGK